MLWDSEWRDASKKTAASNAQAGNSDWDNNILLGEGPDPVLIWGRGSVCVFSREKDRARWLPDKLIRQMSTDSKSSKVSP